MFTQKLYFISLFLALIIALMMAVNIAVAQSQLTEQNVEYKQSIEQASYSPQIVSKSVEFVPYKMTSNAQSYCEAIRQKRADGYAYVALIIDDMGLSSYSKKFIKINNIVMTLSFLPYAKDLREQVKLSRENGHEAMLHMPMEPFNQKIKDSMMIKVAQSDQDTRDLFETALNRIPDLRGVNNHMGSKVTSSAPKMRVLLDMLKSRDMFFVDSKTSPKSVAENLAVEMGVSTIGRDVFLDHKGDERGQTYRLRQTIAKAKKNGVAVAIGHPSRQTYEAIKNVAGKQSEQIVFTSISQVMKVRDCLNNADMFVKQKTPMVSIRDIALIIDDKHRISRYLGHVFNKLLLEEG